MAYGVKYRLIFSDVLGFGKKVEILKKDYTGDVLPMIGGANPVQITWQSSDDFYKPIIGSKCTLSLLVTDTIQYDDFYRFDEREYKVVVSYAKSQGEIFSDRVIEDGGTMESFECVDNVLTNFETISTYYQNRVIEDGGNVESLSCVADAITDDNFYRWGAYWSGFLVVDRYKEKLTTPPFGITINAFDGLGTLNNFDAPIGYNDNNEPTDLTNLDRVKEILQNLDLDLDIYIATDLKQIVTLTTKEFEDLNTLTAGYPEIKGDFGLYDAKEMLEILLNDANARIFQSYNRWYIIEASNIFDYYIKDQLFNEVQTNISVPTNIRNRITAQLNNTKKEFIDFRTYDKDATSLGTKRLQILYDNNNELKAINDDLSREYLQPASQVVTEGEYIKTKNSFYNAGFEYGSYGFNIFLIPGSSPIEPYAEVATDEISFRGQRSLKFTENVPTTGGVSCFSFQTDSFNPQVVSYEDFTFKIKYYIKTTGTQPITSTFQFTLSTVDVGGIKYWNAEDKTFQSAFYTNQITQSDVNVFVNYSTKLNNEGLTIGTSTSRNLILTIRNTQTTSSDYETTYFDNVEIQQEKNISETEDQNFTSKLINPGVKTFIKKRKGIPYTYPSFARTRENYFDFFGDNLGRGKTDLINQNIANDFREFVTRYNGTFRNLKVQPLSIHNKVWFYWNQLETDPQTTIIDGLKYDVKNAAFKIKSHLPNDDDDVDNNFVIN